MYSLKRKLYESLPAGLKAPIGWIPFQILAGAGYRDTRRRGRQLDGASREDLQAFQDQALGRILRHACAQVPAYHSLRFTVDRLPPREALKAFPLVDKQTIQRDLERYLPQNLRRLPHYECTTGGTSGNQFKIYLDDDSQSIEMGFIHRLWARVGYDSRCAKAVFRGVDFPSLNGKRFWKRNPVYREWQFSPYHMNLETLPAYVAQLQRIRVPYLHGYPSAISLLARHILDNDIPADSFGIRAVLLGSETVPAQQRAIIERAFAARAFSWYGHSERVILAGECERTTVYHHFPDYGFLEIIDEAGNDVEHEGDRGELVGTGFWNESLPLIRYRTEDYARKLDWHCACGRSFDRFDCVEGRWKQEYVLGKSGSPISLAALNMHGPAFDRVVRFQYYQNQPGVLEVRVMTTADVRVQVVRDLQRAFARKLGDDELSVRVRVVDSIPLTARGKLKRLIQEIPRDHAGGGDSP